MGDFPDWKSLTLADLIPALGDLQTILDAINAGHEALKVTHDQLKADVNQKVSQLEDIIDSTVDGLNTLKQNIDNTGIFLLFVPPDLTGGGLPQFQTTLSLSLSDVDDPSRPQFAETAFITGFVVLAGGPSLSEAQEIEEKWKKFIDFDPVDLPDFGKLIS